MKKIIDVTAFEMDSLKVPLHICGSNFYYSSQPFNKSNTITIHYVTFYLKATNTK